MSNTLKVAGLIAAGYVLGRTRKLKLALKLAAAGTQVLSREQLQKALGDFGDSAPELHQLQEKISGRLVEAGRSAAENAVTSLTQKLQLQTQKLNASLEDNNNDDDDDAADDADEAAATEQEAEPEEPVEEPEEAPVEAEAPAEEEEATSSQPSSGAVKVPASKAERQQIRQWAQENGYEVATRGRLSKTVLQAYYNDNL